MKTYTEQELRAKDAWIAEHVMGWKPIVRQADSTYPELKYWNMGNGYERLQQQFRPSNDPAAAMQVLQECARRFPKFDLRISFEGGFWFVHNADSIGAKALTLELAIVLFAEKLFGK